VWRSLIRAESIDLLIGSQQRKDDDGQSDERNDERTHRRDGTGETLHSDEAEGQPGAMSEGKRSEQVIAPAPTSDPNQNGIPPSPEITARVVSAMPATM
jgi:hypothetical protein